jgi:chromosome segregation ATPase
MNLTDPLALTASHAMSVPASYAEKAMASLMQLHGELMDEKERRVELFRRLMEKEQALAELKMYVKILEERAGSAREAAPPSQARATRAEEHEAREPPLAPRAAQLNSVPPAVPRVGRRPEGWKVW